MSNIKLLSKSLSQKIAAGEVVERPASVVKELLENSLDAGSTFITVEIEEGGKKLIRISDNGSGIEPNEVELAFLRHATSKIENENDLYNIRCMGFRGEALYSISAVSKTTMITKTRANQMGKKAVVNGGEVVEIVDAGCPDGTTITISDLFFNTPARLKFMKSNAAETSQVSSIVQKMILARPEVSIKFISNGSLIYQSNGDGSIQNAVYSIYGANTATATKEFEFTYNDVKVYGVLGERSTFRSSRINQTLYVNRRYVKDPAINQAIESAYGSVLMKGKFPFYVIYIDVNAQTVDVNVHPQKLYVKFSNQKEVRSAVYEAVKTFSRSLGSVPEIMFNEEASEKAQRPIRKAFSFESENTHHKEDVRETSDGVINENGKKPSPVIEDMQPKTYDYKKELEYLDSIKQPSKLKQTFAAPVDVDIEPIVIKNREEPEQRSYLDDEAQAKIIGAAFDTYIIIEHGEDLYLIDQHAAHERLIYEKLLDQFVHENVVSQHLLIPQDNKITFEEKAILKEYISQLEKLGFSLDFPDELTVSIKSVPHLLGQPRFSSFFVELFDILREESNRDELSVIQKIISMSCKKAIKAGDKLSHQEISLLIKGIKDEEVPLTCPHGRPFVMKITKYQIDKKAGRIV